MSRLVATAAAMAVATQGMKMPEHITEAKLCGDGLCAKPDMRFERILPSTPGYQWNDAGGYCGAWAIQRNLLAKGAYVSQAQVRNHTVPGGGHDNEILSTNIDVALKNLKIHAEGFDFQHEPLPQQDAYFRWLKRQIVNGHPVTWMIMWSGQTYPVPGYGGEPPYMIHGHIEPVVGIMSNHPLDDANVYDDDVAVHYTDNGMNTVYKTMSTLPGTWSKVGGKGQCLDGRYCIGPYSYGWAMQGFLDDANNTVPISLAISPSDREPDTRSGAKPTPIHGTVTVEVDSGRRYDMYRWDSVEDAFDYAGAPYHTFAATDAGPYVFHDPKPFMSDAAAYYSVLEK